MGKRIGAVLAIIGMLLLCLYGAASPEPESVVVRVEAGNLCGSGVLYKINEENLIVATAAHVLEQNTGLVTVTFSDGFSVESSSFHISSTADLAFINVPLQAISDKNAGKYVLVRLDKVAFDALQSGTEVIFLAEGTASVASLEETDVEENPMYTGTVLENWIFVEDFNQYMLLLQGDIDPGMSGGGVFDTADNFLGILCGESAYGEVAAVPLSIIEAEYMGAY